MEKFKGTRSNDYHYLLMNKHYKVLSCENILIAECDFNDKFYMCPLPVAAEANAKLIADAFTTMNKCDLFPSGLLEQRDELLGVIKKIIEAYNGNGNSVLSSVDEAKQSIEKVLKQKQ